MAGKVHEKFMISQWAALINDSKCLILKSADKDHWELPGGRIEVGELEDVTPETAFRREIKEELNIENFEIITLVGAMIGLTLKNRTPVCRLVHLIKHNQTTFNLSEEHKEYKWITVDEVDNFQYAPLHNAKSLNDILKNVFKVSEMYEKK